jgi:recombination protein RecT
MANELELRRATKTTVQKWLNSERMQTFIRRVLPSNTSPEKVLQVYVNLISASPVLQDCTAESLLRVIIFGSQAGLSFDPAFRQAYVVPFGKVATLIVGYKGLELHVLNTGYASSIDAVRVFEKDEFEVIEGSAPQIIHKPNYSAPDRGKVLGVYARAFGQDDKVRRFRFVPIGEITRRRMAGAGKNSPAWTQWEDEMQEKTAIRMFCKRLPQSERSIMLDRIVAADEMADGAPDAQGAMLLGEHSGELMDITEELEAAEHEQAQPRKSRTQAVKEALLAQASGSNHVPEVDRASEVPQNANSGHSADEGASAAALPMSEEEKERANLIDAIAGLVEQSGLKRAQIDIEISAATGGKLQKSLQLNGATIEQLRAVEKHLREMTSRQVRGSAVS